jgi:hypothetical protein
MGVQSISQPSACLIASYAPGLYDLNNKSAYYLKYHEGSDRMLITELFHTRQGQAPLGACKRYECIDNALHMSHMNA